MYSWSADMPPTAFLLSMATLKWGRPSASEPMSVSSTFDTDIFTLLPSREPNILHIGTASISVSSFMASLSIDNMPFPPGYNSLLISTALRIFV